MCVCVFVCIIHACAEVHRLVCSFSAPEVFMNYLDVLVTVASFVEVIFFWAFRTEMGVNPMYSSCSTILSCMSCNSSQPCDPSHSIDWLSSMETVIDQLNSIKMVFEKRPMSWGFVQTTFFDHLSSEAFPAATNRQAGKGDSHGGHEQCVTWCSTGIYWNWNKFPLLLSHTFQADCFL